MKKLIHSLMALTLLAGGISQAATKKAGYIQPAKAPNSQQAEMIQRQYGMFIHFGINTYSGSEWTDGTLAPKIYNPTELDTDQWAKTAKDAGMTYVILITKHHEGFCLWDSPHTKYDVGSSPVKTDVVKSMAASCKKYGIKLGLYYSLWDRNWENGVMRGGNSNLTEKQSDAYVRYMKKQLTELLTNYGDVCELWFDGGWVLPREDWQIDDVYAHVKKLQPDCLVGVNWTIGKVGDPDFHAIRPHAYKHGQPIRYFPSDFRLGDPELPVFPDVKLFSGPDKKLYYLPFETTVCLNSHWFWHPRDKGLRTVDALLPLFERSTAQQNVLILNSPPNRDGLMDQRNIDRLKELAAALGAKPGQAVPLNLAGSASASASSTWQNDDAKYGAQHATDGNPSTRWAAAEKSATLTLEWDKSQDINFLRVREYLDRVSKFKVESYDGKQWKILHSGSSIGANKLIVFPTTNTKQIRLKLEESSDAPSIWHLSAGRQ